VHISFYLKFSGREDDNQMNSPQQHINLFHI